MDIKQFKSLNISDIFTKFSKNLSLVFFTAFLILVVLEIFELKQSVGLILNVNQVSPITTQQKGPRVNFDSYNQIVQRIQAAKNFTPSSTVPSDPFGAGQ